MVRRESVGEARWRGPKHASSGLTGGSRPVSWTSGDRPRARRDERGLDALPRGGSGRSAQVEQVALLNMRPARRPLLRQRHVATEVDACDVEGEGTWGAGCTRTRKLTKLKLNQPLRVKCLKVKPYLSQLTAAVGCT